MSVSFLKHYYNFSLTFIVILRSISGGGKVDSVIIFTMSTDLQICTHSVSKIMSTNVYRSCALRR